MQLNELHSAPFASSGVGVTERWKKKTVSITGPVDLWQLLRCRRALGSHKPVLVYSVRRICCKTVPRADFAVDAL